MKSGVKSTEPLPSPFERSGADPEVKQSHFGNPVKGFGESGPKMFVAVISDLRDLLDYVSEW